MTSAHRPARAIFRRLALAPDACQVGLEFGSQARQFSLQFHLQLMAESSELLAE